MKTQRRFFIVTRVSREDFTDYLSETKRNRMTDTDMKYYARRIEEAIMNSGVYWEVIKQIADGLK